MNILLIDADDDFRRNLATRLSKRGLSVRDTSDTSEAKQLVAGKKVRAILAGLSSARDPLLSFLSEVRQECSENRIILINHSGEVSLSIEAMKLGVADEVGVPVDLEELLAKLTATVSGGDSGQ